MPLTAKGTEILGKMKSEYGSAKGERVFYASKNAGKISGVDSSAVPALDPVKLNDALCRVDALCKRMDVFFERRMSGKSMQTEVKPDDDFNESDHPRDESGKFSLAQKRAANEHVFRTTRFHNKIEGSGSEFTAELPFPGVSSIGLSASQRQAVMKAGNAMDLSQFDKHVKRK